MKKGLGIEIIIRCTDKRQRMKAPLIRSVFKVTDMSEDEYQQAREIIMRHLESANEELAVMAAASGGEVRPSSG